MLLISTPQQRGHSTAALHNETTSMYCRHKVFNLPNRKVRAMDTQERRDIESEKGIRFQPLSPLVRPFLPPLPPRSPRSLSDSERDSTLTKVKPPPPTKSLTVYCSLSSNCPPHSMYNSSFSSTSPISINGSTNVGRHLPPRAILRRRSPACVRTISHALLPANMPQSIPSGSTQSKLLRQQTLSAWIYGGFVCFLFCNEATC